MVQLSTLLFWQMLLLSAVAGACAVRGPLVGVAAFLALVLLAGKRSALCRILMLAAFLLGAALVWAAAEDAPARPSWLVPRKGVLVEGRVAAVSPLAGGRLRLLLAGTRPLEAMPDMPESQARKVRKAWGRTVPAFPEGMAKGWQGEIFDSPDAPLDGNVTLTLDSLALGMLGGEGRPVAGDRLCALVRLFPAGGSINPGTSSLGRYWADRDVWYSARLVRDKGGPLFLRKAGGSGAGHAAAKVREGWRLDLTNGPLYGDAVFSGPPPQGKAIVAALLFGDRSGLAPRTVDLFTRAGLVHSLALSGQHLALAAMAGLLAVSILAGVFPKTFRSVPRRILVVSAGLPFAMAYLFLGGAPLSLIRAALMMGAGAVLLFLRRPIVPLDVLFAAVGLLFLGWPLAVFDLSAQLSVLAVAGILLAMPVVGAFSRRFSAPDDAPLWKRGLLAAVRWTGGMLLVSCAAQAAVLPILADSFGAVSFCFWLNAVWLPPLTFLTLPLAALGFLSCLAGADALASLLLSLAAWPVDVMLAWLEALDACGWLPFVQCFRPSSLSALGYGLTFAGAAYAVEARLLRKAVSDAVKRALALGVFLMLAGQMPQWLDDVQAHREDRVTLTLFDVGHGQAVLVEHGGKRILVDGGGSSSPFFDPGRSLVAPALTWRRMPHLDAVVVTHGDMDHARGLRWILEHFLVDALYWSPVTAARAGEGDSLALRETARKRGIPERLLASGDTLDLGEGTGLEVLWPYASDCGQPTETISDNDASLVIRLVRKGQGLALLCGDLTARSQCLMLEGSPNVEAEILVLPHHGAASGCVPQFYDAVSPRAALASAASFNHYGFPSRRVRETLAERGIPLASTSEVGAIRVVWRQGAGANMMPDILTFP